jgi:tRNA(Ile)-lysidine synthase
VTQADVPAPLGRRLAGTLGTLLGPDFPSHLGLAVSGGGDSMALLHLAAGWARDWGVRLWTVTVDHGLRPESAAEAALVADEARGLGLPHATLRWDGWDGQGNLQDAARRARLDLIGRWRGAVRHVLFAHTRDDQAETFLLRLKRGSGVDGLASMRAVRTVAACPLCAPPVVVGEAPPPDPVAAGAPWFVVRPLLDVTRAELRHHLRVLRIPHADDPGNDDPRFDRVRMRRLVLGLEAEGLGREVLAATAARMARAAEALGARAHAVATELSRVDHGDVVILRDPFAQIERDTQLRLLAAALQFVASAEYRPRAAALEAALVRILGGGAATLHGCVLLPLAAEVRVFREYAAVAQASATVGEGCLWDRRWRVQGAAVEGKTLRALGEDGLAQAGEAARGHGPRAALAATPAVFDQERLAACARLRFGPAYDEVLAPPGGGFPDRLRTD